MNKAAVRAISLLAATAARAELYPEENSRDYTQEWGQAFYRNRLVEATGASEKLREVFRLAQDQSHGITVSLSAGKFYTVLGSCTRFCSALTVAIKRADGSTAAQSSNGLSRAMPFLEWQAESSGRYTIETTADQCTAVRCKAGVQLFESDKPIDSKTALERPSAWENSH